MGFEDELRRCELEIERIDEYKNPALWLNALGHADWIVEGWLILEEQAISKAQEHTRRMAQLQAVNLTLNKLCEICHGANKNWWVDLGTGQHKQRNVGELLMLIASEYAEALEGHRKTLRDDKLPHRSMLEVELADALIRIFDLCGGLKITLGEPFAQWMQGIANFPEFPAGLPGDFDEEDQAAALNRLAIICHEWNRLSWLDTQTRKPVARNVGELLMGCVAQVGRAYHGYDMNLPDRILPNRPMLDARLAHALALTFDMADGLKLDLGGAFVEKMAYNKLRADHQIANRKLPGGKAY